MKHAETVTFGGSGYDRAAQLRTDSEAIARLMADPAARAVALWNGKPLLSPELATLAEVPLDHPILKDAGESPIFIGLDPHPVFAFDVSAWVDPNVDADQLGNFVDGSLNHHPDAQGAVFAELRATMANLSPRDAEICASAKALFKWHKSHKFCAKCGDTSDQSQAGWQRTCPSCKASHFPRTDPVVIMLITHGNNVLLGRSHHWPEGMYSLLAGFVEPGETIEAAVRREVLEEANIKVGPVTYLASQPWAFPMSLMIGCHGQAMSKEITVDPVELDDAIWISREHVMDSLFGNVSGLLPARKGSIAHFLIHNWVRDTLE